MIDRLRYPSTVIVLRARLCRDPGLLERGFDHRAWRGDVSGMVLAHGHGSPPTRRDGDRQRGRLRHRGGAVPGLTVPPLGPSRGRDRRGVSTLECRRTVSELSELPRGGRRPTAMARPWRSVRRADGSGDATSAPPPGAGRTEQLGTDDERHDHGSGAEAEWSELVHEGDPPRRPPRGSALWGRVHQVQHRPRDAGDVLVPVLVEPRPDGAVDVPVGGFEFAH